MPRPQKAPTLRQRQVNGKSYFSTDVTRPDGRRTTLSFGTVTDYVDPMADIGAAFGKWIKLLQADPHKCLSYKSPWEAIDQMDLPVGNHNARRSY